ncbi:MAG: DNA gyrase subunit A, partial [Candidimonas sp.]
KQNGYDSSHPSRKSARIVGDVMGVYHPHGDSAIYDAMVRMAQPFSMRHTLVDGQGNFGTIDGDPPAAMRYTEARLSPFGETIIDGIGEDVVDFVPNYDESTTEPVVLPASLPNLLINGITGIAVGMATSIPTHNLAEVIDATIAMIKKPNLTVQDLMKYIQGPDFPTGGIIMNGSELPSAYESGRGRVIIRAKVDIEEIRRGRKAIVVTEIPYMVAKKSLIEKMAKLVDEKIIDGISDIRDESGRQGMRLVVEIRPGMMVEPILAKLFKHTDLQSSFSINMVALNDGRPQTMSLTDMLTAFIDFRQKVVIRRSNYRRDKSVKRLSLLVGFLTIMSSIDEVIKIIKSSSDKTSARNALMERKWRSEVIQPYMELIGLKIAKTISLSVDQVDAILDLRLHRLTGLEQKAMTDEANELVISIEHLTRVIDDNQFRDSVIIDELRRIKKTFTTNRVTEIKG